jgi:predicted transcriptional regulator of viral defense system
LDFANKLYHPCYIGGWSAAEHWGLTEQIFRTIVVITTQKPRDHQPVIKGTQFLLRCASEQAMFGLKAVWHGQARILISDPTRTLVDLLAVPKLGGGIRNVCDMLVNYLASEYKDLTLLTEYAKQLDNGSVFKRLGFLLELYAPTETTTIDRQSYLQQPLLVHWKFSAF